MCTQVKRKEKGQGAEKTKKMSKPNYGRVTSGLLEAITELNRGGHSGGQNNQRVARADELSARHNASATRAGGKEDEWSETIAPWEQEEPVAPKAGPQIELSLEQALRDNAMYVDLSDGALYVDGADLSTAPKVSMDDIVQPASGATHQLFGIYFDSYENIARRANFSYPPFAKGVREWYDDAVATVPGFRVVVCDTHKSTATRLPLRLREPEAGFYAAFGDGAHETIMAAIDRRNKGAIDGATLAIVVMNTETSVMDVVEVIAIANSGDIKPLRTVIHTVLSGAKYARYHKQWVSHPPASAMRYSTSDDTFVTRRTLVIYFAPLSTADEAHAACTKVTSMLREQYISSEAKEVEIVQCTTTPLADKDVRRGPIDTVPWLVLDDFTDELETDGARVTLAVCSALAQDTMQVPSALVVRKMGDYFSDFSFVPADDISAIWQQENMAADAAVAEEAEEAAAAEEGEAEEYENLAAEKRAVA
jgi:hypothetical protein